MAKRDAHDGLGMLPWYPADWLSSDTHAETTLEAQGALRNLWDREWLSGDCTLPDDDDRLRALAGATQEVWDRIRIAVRSRLVPAGEGKLTNKRLAHEWKKARALRLAKRRAGREGNKVRWGKGKSGVAEGSQSDRSATVERSSPSPSPSPSPENNGPSPNPSRSAGGGNGVESLLREAARYSLEQGVLCDRPEEKRLRRWLKAGMKLDDVKRRIDNREHTEGLPL